MRRDAILPPILALAAGLQIGCETTPYREVTLDLQGGPVATGTFERRGQAQRLRFAVAAMESPRGTAAGYARFLDALGRALGIEVELVQRRTYREVNDMLASGQLDIALVCTGGYFDLRRRSPAAFELIAVPVIDGATTYQSLVIVPAGSGAVRVEDLAGKRFAFTDEISFSGHMYLAGALRQRGADPERFFGETLYTHSHDRSVDAVAAGIVDGAAVSSVVYRHQIARDPSVAARTRVLERSPSFGVMPVVVSTRIPAQERGRIRDVLLELHNEPEAAEAMDLLHVDRFEVPASDLYDSAAVFAEAGE